jgi:hypothetical protein
MNPIRKSEALNGLKRNIDKEKALYDLVRASTPTNQLALDKIRSKLENIKVKRRRLESSDLFLSNAIRCCRNDSMITTLADMTPSTGLRLNLGHINQIQNYFRHHGMNTKCIWLIRDPLSRAISALKMKLANQRYGITSTGEAIRPDGTIPKSISALNERERLEQILKFSRYDRFWCKYTSLEMPKKIYFYEDFFTQSQLSCITHFLGMDEVTLMPNVVNKGEDILIDSTFKASLAKSLEPTYDYVAELYGWKNLPPQWRASYLEICH